MNTTNTYLRAEKWVEFLATRPEFPAGEKLLAAFHAGTISRICECGCNSFDIEIADDCDVIALSKPGEYGSVFEMEFSTNEENTSLRFFIFTGKNGHLAGIDVEYCGNAYPVPENPVLSEPPFDVSVSESLNF